MSMIFNLHTEVWMRMAAMANTSSNAQPDVHSRRYSMIACPLLLLPVTQVYRGTSPLRILGNKVATNELTTFGLHTTRVRGCVWLQEPCMLGWNVFSVLKSSTPIHSSPYANQL